MIAVALDESPDDVRPWAEGVTMPVLIDREHVLTELYAISTVPAVVWIDEDGTVHTLFGIDDPAHQRQRRQERLGPTSLAPFQQLSGPPSRRFWKGGNPPRAASR